MTEPGAVISRSSSATRLSDQLLKAAFGITVPSGGATAGRHDQFYMQSGRPGEICECYISAVFLIYKSSCSMHIEMYCAALF